MFEWLTEFDRVLVTGPHRAGTRICAQMIAYDTGYEFVDEQDFGIDSLGGLRSHLRTRQQTVAQCPALCRHIHMLSKDDTAIILMRREIADIIASQKRIGWSWERLDLARYDRHDGVVSEIKYQFWEDYQKERIKNAFEIEYESLAEHPLWVPKSSRQSFEPGQTRGWRPLLDITPEAILHPYSDVLYWPGLFADEALLAKGAETTKRLNATGRLIWSLCDGTRTRDDVLRDLAGYFEGVEEDVLARDLDKFLERLVADRFLRFSPRETAQDV
jgi:hypothetical protein